MGSAKQTYVADLKDKKDTTSRGKIVLRLDSVNTCNDEARFRARARLV